MVNNFNEEILLSIIVPTFNHEKYIGYAIESIIKQKVNFKYEVLIGEDYSTDNTRSILKEYEKKLDSRFNFYYRKENYYSNYEKYPYGNIGDLALKSKGKYVIILEGDDYWIDEEKLQKQVNFLNNNDDYYAVGHNCIMIDKNGNILNGFKYPVLKKKEYDIKKFPYSYLPGQTASLMYRNPFLNTNDSIKDFLLNSAYGVGDKRTVFFCSTKGKIAIWYKDYMSAYRYITNEGSSYSANLKKNGFINYYNNMMSYFNYCDSNNIYGINRKIAELLYYKLIRICRHKKIITKKEYKENIRKIKNKGYCILNFYLLVIYEKFYLKGRTYKR